MIEVIDAHNVDACRRVFCGNARVPRNTRGCEAMEKERDGSRHESTGRSDFMLINHPNADFMTGSNLPGL